MGFFDNIFAVVKTLPVIGNYYAGGENVTKNILGMGQVKLTGTLTQDAPTRRQVTNQIAVKQTDTGTKPTIVVRQQAPQQQKVVNNVTSRTVQVPKSVAPAQAWLPINNRASTFIGLNSGTLSRWLR